MELENVHWTASYNSLWQRMTDDELAVALICDHTLIAIYQLADNKSN